MITRALAVALLGLVVTAGCGDGDTGTHDGPAGDESPAACPVDDPNCYETGAENSGG